jgi:hypothetical protein
MVRLPIATALLVAVGFCSTVGGEDATPELKAKPYWIGVTASHVAEPAGPLFAADAPWKEGLAGVEFYKFYGVQAAGAEWATELNVSDFVAFCKRNDLWIACEFGNFSVKSGRPLSETAFEHVVAQLDPIIAAGGRVSSIDLDGPVRQTVKGVVKHPDALELDGIAQEMVRFFKLVRERYPEIQVGLIPNLPNWDYTRELAGYNGHNTDGSGHTYLAALERISKALQASGDKLDFVEVDCPYNYYRETRTRKGDAPVDNAKKLLALQAWCEKNSAEFRLIVNAEHRGGGGNAFHDLTLEYVRDLRRDGVFPDGFIIQSWYNKPDKNLPETEADTFTNTLRDTVRLINELFPKASAQGE